MRRTNLPIKKLYIVNTDIAAQIETLQQSVPVGHSTWLKCHSYTDVLWKLNNKSIPKDIMKVLKGDHVHTLFIESFQLYHIGQYTCRGSHVYDDPFIFFISDVYITLKGKVITPSFFLYLLFTYYLYTKLVKTFGKSVHFKHYAVKSEKEV